MRGFTLSGAVGRGTAGGNRLADTMKLKLGLERLGYYSPGARGFIPGADDELWSGLERYQGDRGLEVDALALPDGPTLASLNHDLEGVPDGSILTGDPMAPVSPEAASSNRRTARALSLSRDPGDVPALMAASLKAGGETSAAENADLLAQARAHAPEQADKLQAALADMIGDDAARLGGASRARGEAGGQETPIEEPSVGETRQSGAVSNASSRATGGSVDANTLFDAYLPRLYEREGGYMKDPDRGETFKGVTQETLTSFNKLHPEKGFPNNVTELTEEQRAEFYRTEFFKNPKLDRLAAIPGLQEAAPQLTEQMFDAGVLHGPATAVRWLQESLDQHLGTRALGFDRPEGSVAYDGILGKDTRAAVERAIREGVINDVSNSVVDRRIRAMEVDPVKARAYPGWFPRARSFRR